MTSAKIRNPRWFKIYQADGKPTMHDAHFIAGLVIISAEDALGDLLHRPFPVVIPTIPERTPQLVATKQDIADRSGATMPGWHPPHSINHVHRFCKHATDDG